MKSVHQILPHIITSYDDLSSPSRSLKTELVMSLISIGKLKLAVNCAVLIMIFSHVTSW